jgi:microcystin degradation protein MlrC
MRNINVGLAGFVMEAEAQGFELVPTIFAAASPCAHVTEDAYERIASTIVEGIRKAGAIDAVYLDLHGAMVSEHLDDGEGEILARVRRTIGSDLPLVASLDLHANVTPEMVRHADALIAYRTYPHVDMAETGRAAARHLALLLANGRRFAKSFRQLPFMIPISPPKAFIKGSRRWRARPCRRCPFAPDFRPPIFLTAEQACLPMGKRRPMRTPRQTNLPR